MTPLDVGNVRRSTLLFALGLLHFVQYWYRRLTWLREMPKHHLQMHLVLSKGFVVKQAVYFLVAQETAPSPFPRTIASRWIATPDVGSHRCAYMFNIYYTFHLKTIDSEWRGG